MPDPRPPSPLADLAKRFVHELDYATAQDIRDALEAVSAILTEGEHHASEHAVAAKVRTLLRYQLKKY